MRKTQQAETKQATTLQPDYHGYLSPQSKNEDAEYIIQRKWRSPRHSLTQSGAVVVVKDALIESAKGVIQYSNLLLEPHNGTGALTDIMMSVTKDEDMRSLRKAKLKRLRELLTRTEVSPKELLTSEVIELAYDLELESLIFKNIAYNMEKPTTIENNLLTTPRTIRQSILEKTSRLEKALEPLKISLTVRCKGQLRNQVDTSMPIQSASSHYPATKIG